MTWPIAGVCLAAMAFCAGQAAAAPAMERAASPPRAMTERSTPGVLPDGVKMSAEELASVSGGQSIYASVTTQTLQALASGQLNANTVENGAISFTQGALQGFSGIGNFVLNTGNNNVLQGAISLTIVPPP
jgi:hypothetical protein